MASSSSANLDLSSCPPIFLLPTHLQTDDLHEAEDAIYHAGGQLTYHAPEARVFLGRVSQKKRAAFDLRAKEVWTEESPIPSLASFEQEQPVMKKRKLSHEPSSSTERNPIPETAAVVAWPDLEEYIIVLKLDWLNACIKQNQALPYQSYVVYTGKIVPKPAGESSPKALDDHSITYIKASPESPTNSKSAATAFRRPLTNTTSASSSRRRNTYSNARRSPTLTHHLHPPKLHRTTTSEYDALTIPSSTLPPAPPWVRDNLIYSCQRDTPANPPNALFIAQLTKIKDARLLTLDDVGVRAYSTSIASLAAYPYLISHAAEILRLPGCDAKIATLWSEWFDSSADEGERWIQTVRDLDHDEDLKHLRMFWEIWGVGPDTARKFYFEFGWKEIDDIVEFGWQGLNRVQQIGVKFYEEFKVKIPRQEVEEISEVVKRHARLCKGIKEDLWGTTGDIEVVIVGGYRRGKKESGDVDVILSHRHDDVTRDLVVDVVRSLETEGYVTHTLSLQTTTSDRAQQTLPYRSKGGGHGFDSLDKALCVWQDPNFDDQGGKVTKNPNIHRRVDIIVSAWRTVGSAVLGWSGGTTFQRDIRRYAKKVKGWKFDSSGVRNRGNGIVLNLESPRNEDEADGWLDRERRLMDGFGFGWRDPTMRCTG